MSPHAVQLWERSSSAPHLNRNTKSGLGMEYSTPFTFSRWMSFLIWDILIFMASSSSSGTSGILGTASDSSTIWKLRSVSGMYHLQSYCWLFLKDRRSKPFTIIGVRQCPLPLPHYGGYDTEMGTNSRWLLCGKSLVKGCIPLGPTASTARNRATCLVIRFFSC